MSYVEDEMERLIEQLLVTVERRDGKEAVCALCERLMAIGAGGLDVCGGAERAVEKAYSIGDQVLELNFHKIKMPEIRSN